MSRTRRRLVVAILLASALGGALNAPARGDAFELQHEGEPIDLVIALDTSGTMRQLIDSARLGLWEIVNDLAQVEPTPRLRVALLTYGNQSGSPATGWVRVETDLTGDLDRVSERLFALQSRGADELVGRVLKTALDELSWSQYEGALRLLFIAGNESADQDYEYDFRQLSEEATRRDILIGAVFCGSPTEAAAVTWKEMAELANGSFAAFDHHSPALIVSTPFDRALAELGELINETSVPLGKDGAKSKRTRAKQDRNARSLGLAVAATRAQTKASGLYWSETDLIHAYESGRLDLQGSDDADLPRALRKRSPDERLAFVEELLVLRQDIRQQIAELSAQRQAYISEWMAAKGIQETRTFDGVLRQAIREKAEEKGFRYPE